MYVCIFINVYKYPFDVGPYTSRRTYSEVRFFHTVEHFTNLKYYVFNFIKREEERYNHGRTQEEPGALHPPPHWI